MATLCPSAAGVTRQPFAPINGSRLQNLTSLKNRQNALPQSHASPTKRKAAIYEDDADAENVSPVSFSKRSKGDSSSVAKPPTFILTKTPTSSLARPTLTPKSPANILTAINPMLSAPAGRSPTRKRAGPLNRRQSASPFTRIDPPNFSSTPSSSLPFSLATALSGTTPLSRPPIAPSPLSQPQSTHKSSWDFEIHEDTAEETLTNLMEHSTCKLDISSDEETESRRRAEGKGKENVPPMDDEVYAQGSNLPSQQGADTGKDRLGRRRREENEIEVDRRVLGEVPVEDLYTEDAAAEAVIVADENEASHDLGEAVTLNAASFDLDTDPPSLDRKGKGKAVDVADVDELMRKSEALAPEKAALLQPLEKAEEGWVVWESGSANGDD